MKRVTQGSVLLTIFLILSSLSLLCCVVWRTATLTFDVVLKKQEFESYYQTTAAFLKHTTELSKNNFESLQTYLKVHKDLYAHMPVKSHNKKQQQCMLKMTRVNDDTLALTAKLQEHEQHLYTLSCLVVRTKISSEDVHDASKDYFAVASWKKNGSAYHG